MSKVVILEAELRDRAGKGAARATRRAGRVPAVIYGDKKEPINISLDPKVLGRELGRGGFFGRLLDIKLGSVSHRTLPRDVQLHPVTDVPLHVDFVRVNASTRIHVRVPVVFDNQDKAPGIKRGGVVNIVSHDVEVICAADSIPDRLHVDLTGYDIGDNVHLSMLTLPDGVVAAPGDDITLVTIAPPTVDEEGAAA
jgi:large subunit ribosomal protein L25